MFSTLLPGGWGSQQKIDQNNTQPFSHIDSKGPYLDKRVRCQRILDDHLHGNVAKFSRKLMNIDFLLILPCHLSDQSPSNQSGELSVQILGLQLVETNAILSMLAFWKIGKLSIGKPRYNPFPKSLIQLLSKKASNQPKPVTFMSLFLFFLFRRTLFFSVKCSIERN